MIYELRLRWFMHVSEYFGTITNDLETSAAQHQESPLLAPLSRKMAKQAIRDLASDVTAGIPISPVLALQAKKAAHRFRTDKALTEKEAANVLRDLHESFAEEFNAHLCLIIDAPKADFYNQKAPFGLLVADRFNEASDDLMAAARCVALDESTAAVFHLMRAVEYALQSLATKLGIKGVVVKEWARLLHDIDGALATMRQRPRTAKRDRDLEYYSQARASIAGFNDAWRKHVAHARGTYNERNTMDVWNAVKSFMQLLASQTATR